MLSPFSDLQERISLNRYKIKTKPYFCDLFYSKTTNYNVYNSRTIKRRSSLSMSSFFPIIDFYIIKPASMDFLSDQIYIKLPNNSFFLIVLACFAMDNTQKQVNSCCFN